MSLGGQPTFRDTSVLRINSFKLLSVVVYLWEFEAIKQFLMYFMFSVKFGPLPAFYCCSMSKDGRTNQQTIENLNNSTKGIQIWNHLLDGSILFKRKIDVNVENLYVSSKNRPQREHLNGKCCQGEGVPHRRQSRCEADRSKNGRVQGHWLRSAETKEYRILIDMIVWQSLRYNKVLYWR